MSFVSDLITVALCLLAFVCAYYTFFTTFVVEAVISFVLIVISLSIAFFMNASSFLSVLFIIVYVGAIAVLLIFVLMIVNLRNEIITTRFSATNSKSKMQNFVWSIINTLLLFCAFFYCRGFETGLNNWLDMQAFINYKTWLTSFNAASVSYMENSYIQDYFLSTLYLDSMYNVLNNAGTPALILSLLNLVDTSVLNTTELDFALNAFAQVDANLSGSTFDAFIFSIFDQVANQLGVDFVFDIKANQQSSTLLYDIYTNKYRDLLFVCGSLLLVALIASVYITKEE